MTESTFLFGANYYPLLYPEQDWARDFRNMAAAGMNAVRTAELIGSWDRIELVEGKYEFDWLDRMFDLAAENGIKIICGTGTPSPPSWLYRKYPDITVVDSEGRQFKPGGMWNWPSRNHEGFRTEVRRWLDVLVRRYRDHDALAVWQINNEPGYPFRPEEGKAVRRYDFNPSAIARFRVWLQERYGSIDELNQAWKSTSTMIGYEDFQVVEPPDSSPLAWGGNTAWVDWMTFLGENFAEYLQWENDEVKRLDPVHTTMVNTYVLRSRDEFGVWTGMDAWRIADTADVIGMDLYPGRNEHFKREPEYVSLFLDLAWSIAKHRGKQLWLPEMEGGPIDGWFLGPSHATDGEDVVRFTVEGLAHGGKEISYHPWRDHTDMPIHWGAPADMNGEPTEIAERIAELAAVIEQHRDLLAAAQPLAADVAILWDRTTAMHLSGVDQTQFYLDAIRGAYKALWSAQVPVEFVTPREVAEGKLSGYRVVLLPFAISMSQETGARIADWVAGGGLLVGTAKCPQVDERGWWYGTIPGAGLADVFGVTQRWIEKSEDTSISLAADAIPGWTGGTVEGSWHIATVELGEGATAVGHFADGRPAVVVNDVGSGRAVYVATHVDHACAITANSSAAALLRTIVAWGGVQVPVRTSPGSDHGVRARLLSTPADERVLFVINTGPERPVTVSLREPAHGPRDLVSGALVSGGQVLQLHVPARSYRALTW